MDLGTITMKGYYTFLNALELELNRNIFSAVSGRPLWGGVGLVSPFCIDAVGIFYSTR